MNVTITNTQRENLTKLAEYLEKLPDDYQYFGMRSYVEERDSLEAIINYAKHNGGVHTCGTAACAVGHGPAAGILFREDEFEIYEDKNGNVIEEPSWDIYAERFVDDACAFDFLFSGLWTPYDNSHQGAAKRIRYFLENGIPKEFEDEDNMRPYNFRATTEVVNAYFSEKVK